MTEKELSRLYKTYNRKYFDGKLPESIPVQLVDMSATDKGGLCTTYAEPGLILHNIHLDSTFKDYDQIMKWFLLHEMAHIKLFPNGEHDGGAQERAFDEEMMRLAFRGAFRGIW